MQDTITYSLGLLITEKERIESELKQMYEKVMTIGDDQDYKSVYIQQKMLLKVDNLTKIIQQIELLKMTFKS